MSGPTTANLPGVDPGADGRLHAASAERNRAPIAEALRPRLAGRRGRVLEIGSGTGQHAVHLAAAFPDLDWQPSDAVPEHLASIRAWAAEAALPNLAAPLMLDALQPWPVAGPLAAVLAINVIHIAPWRVAEAIVAGAGRLTGPGGLLILYGPYTLEGRHNAESNAAFDASLRARNPDWGVRDVGAVAALAAAAGFGAPALSELPANNRLLAFEKP